MATVLNRATKALITSANTPDYPVADWIVEPDLSAVAGQPVKYWSISGDTVSLMSQAERDAVDAAELTVKRDAVVAQIDRAEDIIRALALCLLDEINVLRTNAGLQPRTAVQFRTALRNKLGL